MKAQAGESTETTQDDDNSTAAGDQAITDRASDGVHTEDGAESTVDSSTEEKPMEPVDVDALMEKLNELEATHEENLAQMARLQDARLRLQAEFDNYRRRTRQEIEAIRQNAAESVATQLLPVIDNFERALAAAGDDPQVVGFVQGVELIYKQFIGVLADVGVEPIPTQGVPFDPQVHEAVASEVRADVQAGTVIEEVRRGYTLNGKVLRVGLVKVAAAPATKEENDHE